jgi:uncharacterized membrane protein
LSSRTLQHVAGVLALAGIAVASYLTWAHYADASVVCLRGGGCETVQKSSYAELAGVPVAGLGLGYYIAMLLLLAWDTERAQFAAATLGFVGLLFSVYLLVVQAFVIDAFCIWCLANDLAIAPGLALIAALRLRGAPSG